MPSSRNDRDTALQHFKSVDKRFHDATKANHAALPLILENKRTTAALFESLIRIVTSQQLATKAASSIFVRVKEVCKGSLTPESILRVRESSFRKAGLSGSKIKTIKEIAKAVKNKKLDLLSLKRIPEGEASEKLQEIWGLGPWSSEMFLMFSLGRGDVFSVGDLGLIRAIETIYGLPKNAPRTSLLAIAEKWSPHRTYACLLLWLTRDEKK
ncbi:MAG: HhH-GPD family protein [Parcubacteria group bacterium]|nr:HhH-GPD family protein [Parcubacteria group bacterium]